MPDQSRPWHYNVRQQLLGRVVPAMGARFPSQRVDNYQIKVDPAGSKIPTDHSKNGLVISVPLRIDGDQISMDSGLDPQELRANLLLWDLLDFPSNNFIHIELGNDESYLERCGVLQRSICKFSGGGGGAKIFPLRISDIGLDFNIGSIANAVIATGAASFAGLPLLTAAMGGALVGAVSLNASVGLKNGKCQPTPFQYVARYHTELF